MAKLTRDDIIHVAKLSRLKLTEEEVKKFQKQLSTVIEYISELDEVDTKGVEPTSQTTGLENVTRDDQLKDNTLKNKEATSGTEEMHNGYFKVPMILEERSV